ncbi:hypothetical protein [Streptomyces collinus]|uniref:hypothetical protein n=1 Tax=Streptomyces collinus TaxID=42684 RepID=UPI00382305CB
MLLLGEMALQVDVPELIHRSDLPQNTATFMRVLQKHHKVPRDVTTHRQVGASHDEVHPCCIDEPGREPEG